MPLNKVRRLGVLNVTPDSFSDGGRYLAPDQALARACALWDAGAEFVDVGAESTRPGAADVSVDEELTRLQPVFNGLRGDGRSWSIDTQKPEIMRAALAAGAVMINDVNALQAEGAIAVAAESTVPVVVMHRQGVAQTMQDRPAYGDVVADVIAFLQSRVDACVQGGVAHSRVVVDPGIGFGKTLEHNLALLRATSRIRQETGCPIMIGVSRKSMFRDLLGIDAPEERVAASAWTSAWAAAQGADYLRVHDVPETRQALTLMQALTPGAAAASQNEEMQ